MKKQLTAENMFPAVRSWMNGLGITQQEAEARCVSTTYGWGEEARQFAKTVAEAVAAEMAATPVSVERTETEMAATRAAAAKETADWEDRGDSHGGHFE